MLTKRKTQLTHQKSKQKIRTSKQLKKVKKDIQQKAVDQHPKPNVKITNQAKLLFEDFCQQNQNENRSNILINHTNHNNSKYKINNGMHPHKQHQVINMRRSASTAIIKPIKHTRKSMSPGISKQARDKSDIKHKYSSKQTSRQQKQKLKQPINLVQKLKSVTLKRNGQNSQKQKLNKKKSQKTLKNHSQRLKTQTSSKLPDFKQKDQKLQKITHKKIMRPSKTKKVMNKSDPSKVKSKTVKLKQKQRNSIVFSDVSFHDPSPLYSVIAPKQNFFVRIDKNQNLEQERIISACITIQRHFRGYLTRKYIQQAQHMSCCIVKIQKVWRGYLCRKKIKKEGNYNKKNLSIQNSLITIKDFSQQPKEERIKNKTFKFQFQQLSRKNGSQNFDQSQKKQNKQQKYISMLESLLQEQGLEQKFKQKIRDTLGKQKYVKNKIKSQIISQKSFNSPRQIRSPKSAVIVNSPSSWNKIKQTQIIQNVCNSPRHSQINQSVFKRIVSPIQNKQIQNSKKKKNSQKKIEDKLQISPFQTSFPFIQQFELKIVDFLRDNPLVKDMIIQFFKKCQQFKTCIIMSHWNNKKLYYQEESSLEFLFCDIYPDIFSTPLKQQIINQNPMKQYLQDNNYFESLWKGNKIQKDLYEGFIRCLFDGLSEAIYENYKTQIVTNQEYNIIRNYNGQYLFRIVLTNTLTLIQEWNEYMCGAQIPAQEGDPNYIQYCNRNNERLDLMISQQIKKEQFKDHGAWKLWTELNIGQLILHQLIQQLYNQNFI